MQCGVSSQKIVNAKDREKVEKLQEKFKGFTWIKPEIQAEMDLIYSYFKDREPLQFILDTAISLKVTQHMTFELVRTDHKVYKPTEKNIKTEFGHFLGLEIQQTVIFTNESPTDDYCK